MQELLTRIEELEMAGPENYRLQLLTRNPFSSGTPGQAMDANQIFSQSKLYSDNDSWYVTTGSESTWVEKAVGCVYF